MGFHNYDRNMGLSPACKVKLVKAKEHDDSRERVHAVEMIFEEVKVPSWKNQLTLRAFVVSFFLSALFSFIGMEASFSTGGELSMIAFTGLFGYLSVKTWTLYLDKCGMLKYPFTRQENALIVSYVITSFHFCGTFVFFFGMSTVTAKQNKETTDAKNIKDPGLAWMMGFLCITSFIGLFAALPFQKRIITDCQLPNPGATAASHLINSFHIPQTTKLTRKQVRLLAKVFSFSFLLAIFKWFFAAGRNCGFANFPIFGLNGLKNGFYFDFSAAPIGTGMLCPTMVNISLFIGMILHWVLQQYVSNNNQRSANPVVQGFFEISACSLFLGDGLYHLFKLLAQSLIALCYRLRNKGTLPFVDLHSTGKEFRSYNDKCRTDFFLKDQIPSWVAICGYIAIVTISTVALPYIFSPLKWYHVLTICIFIPAAVFCDALMCGRTGLITASALGTISMYAIGPWIGAIRGEVLACLVAYFVVMNAITVSTQSMQGSRIGYLTRTSPYSTFVTQAIGTVMAAVINPCIFWLFFTGIHDLGTAGSQYPINGAKYIRYKAGLAMEVFSSLPGNYILLCCIFFAAAILINIVKDSSPQRFQKYFPIPLAMAAACMVGPYFTISRCLGGLIIYFWQRRNYGQAKLYGSTIAAGLICGEQLWSFPRAVLSFFGVKPQICVKFLSRETNEVVESFLGSQS